MDRAAPPRVWLPLTRSCAARSGEDGQVVIPSPLTFITIALPGIGGASGRGTAGAVSCSGGLLPPQEAARQPDRAVTGSLAQCRRAGRHAFRAFGVPPERRSVVGCVAGRPFEPGVPPVPNGIISLSTDAVDVAAETSIPRGARTVDPDQRCRSTATNDRTLARPAFDIVEVAAIATIILSVVVIAYVVFASLAD